MRAPWGLAVLAFAMGCGGTTLVVDSDTSWAGTVDGYGAISGRLRAEYELEDAGGRCWTVSKTTEAGTLRVYSRQERVVRPRERGERRVHDHGAHGHRHGVRTMIARRGWTAVAALAVLACKDSVEPLELAGPPARGCDRRRQPAGSCGGGAR